MKWSSVRIRLTLWNGAIVAVLMGAFGLVLCLRVQAELRNALHAEALLRRDVDYIVRDGRIELVDELTGRIAENRHWPDGLQSALEAKEGLVQQPEGKILSSITIQHYLRKYPRLCGITATARAAAAELAKVYDLGVVTVPPHRPCLRVDPPPPTRRARPLHRILAHRAESVRHPPDPHRRYDRRDLRADRNHRRRRRLGA